jgi:hypothetical protein
VLTFTYVVCLKRVHCINYSVQDFFYITWTVHQYLLKDQRFELYLDLLALPQNCEELLLDLSCLSLCLSVRLCATIRLLRDGFLWILIFEDLQISVKKIQVSLKSEKNNGTLNEDQCTFMTTTRLILLRMRNISQNYVRENHDTHFLFNTFFRKAFFLWDNVETCDRAWQTKYDKIIRCRKDAICRRLIQSECRPILYS